MGIFKKDSDLNKLDTLIGNGTTIEGILSSGESICVEGTVKGKVTCDGTVIIGEKGRVVADILADNVLLGGVVEGNIMAKSKLEITTTGKLKGNIKTGSLVIAEGVHFDGKCQMIAEENNLDDERERENLKGITLSEQ